MKSRIFLFVGIILIGVGLIVFFSLNGAKMNVHGPGFQTVSAETEQLANVIIRYGVPGLLSGLGLIFLIAGFVGMGKAGNQNKMMKAALQYGTETEGTITFVDKNYTLLVNSFQLAGGKLSEEYLNARAEQNRREASFEQLSFNWWSGGICYRERTPAQ